MVDPTLAIGLIGAIIIIGVLVFRLSERFKFPHILVLILLGILVGPILKLFNPADYTNIVHSIVTFALVIVLFDAGYGIKFGRLKKEIGSSMRLTIPAFLLSVLVAMVLSMVFFKFSWQNALLIGAILSSTDITIIAPLLKILETKPQLKDVLNLEATINSVFAIILATVIVGLSVSAENTLYSATQTFLYQIFVGVGLGVVFGYLLVFILKHVKVEQMPEILSIGAILLIYSISQFIGASGIFAVFVAGMIFGNTPQTKLKRIIESFQTSIAFLIVVFIYVILGAMLNLDVFLSAGLFGIIFAFLIVLSRAPAAWGFRFSWKEESKFLFLVGPRGMTCVVLALFFAENFKDPNLILGLVFMTVLISVLLASVAYKLVYNQKLISKAKPKQLKRPAKRKK